MPMPEKHADLSRTRGLESPEGTPRVIEPVISALKKLNLVDIKTRLDKQHEVDPTVGITIIHLSEEEAPAVTIVDRVYHFHAGSFRDAAVVPHYHPNKGELSGQDKVKGPDDEPYIALTPIEMNTAPVVDGIVGEWSTDYLNEGEIFVVDPNVVHSARDGMIAFACPHDHLKNYDPETEEGKDGNRIMTGVLENGVIKPLVENGIPPHYLNLDKDE